MGTGAHPRLALRALGRAGWPVRITAAWPLVGTFLSPRVLLRRARASSRSAVSSAHARARGVASLRRARALLARAHVAAARTRAHVIYSCTSLHICSCTCTRAARARRLSLVICARALFVHEHWKPSSSQAPSSSSGARAPRAAEPLRRVIGLWARVVCSCTCTRAARARRSSAVICMCAARAYHPRGALRALRRDRLPAGLTTRDLPLAPSSSSRARAPSRSAPRGMLARSSIERCHRAAPPRRLLACGRPPSARARALEPLALGA